MIRRNILGMLATAAFMLSGCSEPGVHSQGVYMLVDTSGTYTQEIDKAQRIISFILAKLEPGDSFAVASINTGSFSEKNIVAKMHLEGIPSKANQQKRAFQQTIHGYVDSLQSSPYTDITGGTLQAIEFLNESGAGRKTILIFSDMQEDLMDGYVRDMSLELNGFEVVALNVSKLRPDNLDPRKYFDRLEQWKQRVETGGGAWRVINDLERLDNML